MPYAVWRMCARKRGLTRKQALAEIQRVKRRRKRQLYTYVCPRCGRWHLTQVPQ